MPTPRFNAVLCDSFRRAQVDLRVDYNLVRTGENEWIDSRGAVYKVFTHVNSMRGYRFNKVIDIGSTHEMRTIARHLQYGRPRRA